MRSRLEKVAGIIFHVFLTATWIFACWSLRSTLRDESDATSSDWVFKQTCGGFLFASGGLFILAGEHYRWDWFVNYYKHKRNVKLFGETGARILNITIGVSMISLGMLMLAAIVF